MSDARNPFTYLDLVEIYDGTGRHLGGFYPPLAVDNVLTPAYTYSKSVRPLQDALYYRPEDAHRDIGLVWMLPLQMPLDTPLPREVIAEVVYAVDTGKTVMMHGDDPVVMQRVRVTVGMFAGGGHA